MSSGRIAVYTCVTGGYEPRQDEQHFGGADFYYFTDGNITSFCDNLWIEKKATNLFSDPRRNARYHKLLSHEMFPDYDYTIWIDGSVILKIPAEDLIHELGFFDVMTSFHPNRKTIQEEAEECKRLNLDYPGKIDDHVKRILDDGFPDDVGLAETKVVVRKNNEAVKRFNELWFYKLATGSLRDQLTFPYAAWKTKINVKYMDPISKQKDRFGFIKEGDHVTRRTYE